MRDVRRRAGDAVQPRIRWRLGVLVGAALAVLVGFQIPASAAVTDPYPTGAKGFDISYPNCSSTLPAGDSFAIVGVGGGRPFTASSCASSEWSQAQSATNNAIPSLYFNTGYSGAYGREIEGACKSAISSAGVFSGLSKHVLSQAEQAWEIGCSEVEYASTVVPKTPALWWADIETGNSWSANPSLNQYTIDGISYEMQQLGGGGIYSSPAMWASITGSAGWEPIPAVAANWVSGASCSTTFGGMANWLAQGSPVSGVDSDTAC